jgi:hypothetical protein
MLHCFTVNGAVHQLQRGQAGVGLSSKQVEEGATTQLCSSQAEAVKAREGLRDEMSATRCVNDLCTTVTGSSSAWLGTHLSLTAQLRIAMMHKAQSALPYL